MSDYDEDPAVIHGGEVLADFRRHTCSECEFWVRADPASGGPAILSAEKQGECREQLHMVPLPVVNQITGQVDVQLTALYARTPGGYPACGRFWKRGGP
jgi:hypothetical protein